MTLTSFGHNESGPETRLSAGISPLRFPLDQTMYSVFTRGVRAPERRNPRLYAKRR